MTYTELETAYTTLCKAVERDAKRIAGLCLAKRTDDAGEAAVCLADTACTALEQMRMQKETSAPEEDRYDLKTLPPMRGDV